MTQPLTFEQLFANEYVLLLPAVGFVIAVCWLLGAARLVSMGRAAGGIGVAIAALGFAWAMWTGGSVAAGAAAWGDLARPVALALVGALAAGPDIRSLFRD